MRYYILADDKIKGPFEPRELLDQPEVGEETSVCTTERFSEWMSLGSVDELRLLLEMRLANRDLQEKKNSCGNAGPGTRGRIRKLGAAAPRQDRRLKRPARARPLPRYRADSLRLLDLRPIAAVTRF